MSKTRKCQIFLTLALPTSVAPCKLTSPKYLRQDILGHFQKIASAFSAKSKSCSGVQDYFTLNSLYSAILGDKKHQEVPNAEAENHNGSSLSFPAVMTFWPEIVFCVCFSCELDDWRSTGNIIWQQAEIPILIYPETLIPQEKASKAQNFIKQQILLWGQKHYMKLKIISFYSVSFVRYKRNAVLIKRSKSGRMLCPINISIINYNQSPFTLQSLTGKQWDTTDWNMLFRIS